MVVRAYWDRIWNEGDVDAVSAVVADRYVRHSASGTMVRDPESVGHAMRRYRATLAGVAVTIEDQVHSGNTVWSRLTLRALNIETESPVVLFWLHVARVEAGRIVEVWSLNAPVDWGVDRE